MSKYQRLLDYISYFENEETEFCKWESGYPDYDDQLKEFIKETYATDLLVDDYVVFLESNVKEQDISFVIPSADLELLKAILTYYARQERFCDGLWAKAVKEKVFLRIHYRLGELEEWETV